jgi:hypothetical protein
MLSRRYKSLHTKFSFISDLSPLLEKSTKVCTSTMSASPFHFSLNNSSSSWFSFMSTKETRRKGSLEFLFSRISKNSEIFFSTSSSLPPRIFAKLQLYEGGVTLLSMSPAKWTPLAVLYFPATCPFLNSAGKASLFFKLRRIKYLAFQPIPFRIRIQPALRIHIVK